MVEKWSKNGLKMVPRQAQTIFLQFFTMFLQFFDEIKKPKGTAAEGRRPLWGAAGGRPLYFIKKIVRKCKKL